MTVRDQVEERIGVAEVRPTGGRLRLVGRQSVKQTGAGHPLTGAGDPRWVLAVRTAEQLQGMVLPPERRDRLIRLGRVLGLSAFDSNLVIAIVQDQARRGYAPQSCPAAGEAQLRFVPLPDRSDERRHQTTRRWLLTCALVAVIIALEAMLLKAWFGG